MGFLRQIWFKIRHPRALAKFDTGVVKSFGAASAVAGACRAGEVQPIHVLYGLLKAGNGSGTDHAWLSEEKRTLALDGLERMLGPVADGIPAGLPPGEAVRRLTQKLVADTRQAGRFLITPRDLRRELARLHDRRVDEFAASQGLLLAE